MGVAIAALIVIHVTLCVEACIQRNSKQLLEQTVMREEAPDYYLGEVGFQFPFCFFYFHVFRIPNITLTFVRKTLRLLVKYGMTFRNLWDT